jgi:hypothetical protein
METIRDTVAFATIKSEHNLVTPLGTGDPCDPGGWWILIGIASVDQRGRMVDPKGSIATVAMDGSLECDPCGHGGLN